MFSRLERCSLHGTFALWTERKIAASPLKQSGGSYIMLVISFPLYFFKTSVRPYSLIYKVPMFLYYKFY